MWMCNAEFDQVQANIILIWIYFNHAGAYSAIFEHNIHNILEYSLMWLNMDVQRRVWPSTGEHAPYLNIFRHAGIYSAIFGDNSPYSTTLYYCWTMLKPYWPIFGPYWSMLCHIGTYSVACTYSVILVYMRPYMTGCFPSEIIFWVLWFVLKIIILIFRILNYLNLTEFFYTLSISALWIIEIYTFLNLFFDTLMTIIK